MNKVIYTYTELPKKLRLVDGELVCADDSDVREYLRDFALKANITAETKLVLMKRDAVESLQATAYIAQGWAS